jgi:hypothetical protein
MRLPRMTTRRWIIGVAAVAFVIAGERTRRAAARYRVQAEYHALQERSSAEKRRSGEGCSP